VPPLPRRGVGSKAMELIMAKALAEQCPFPQAARPAPRHEGRTCGATVRVREWV